MTASMLASAHPTVKYKGSKIFNVGYGPREGGGVALGSLDLLDLQRLFEIVAVTAKAVEANGQSEQEVWKVINHWSIDLVVMNPPFTRDTGHEGEKIGVPNPMFAAFGLKRKNNRKWPNNRTAAKRDECPWQCRRGQRFPRSCRPQTERWRNSGHGHAIKFNVRRSMGRVPAASPEIV